LVLLGVVACNDADGSSAAALPVQPDTFHVELSGTPCFGDCPTYSASIDQDGKVRFVGERCVARPGVFEYEVSAADARAVYDALIATKYASLRDRYVDEEDGCDVFTDAPTYTWNVLADDRQKPLTRYGGCEGVDGLDDVDAVMSVLHERAEVNRYLKPALFNCDYQPAKVLDVSLQLSRAGVPLAVLKLASSQEGWSGDFELSDCSGASTAHGDIRLENGRWVLLAEQRTPIALPGALGDAGSLVVDLKSAEKFGADATIRGVRALRETEDVTFDFKVGDACE
jgi:hypothetical protein